MAFGLRPSRRQPVESGEPVRQDRVGAEGAPAADAAPGRRGRRRPVAARGAWAVGSLLLLISRIVRLLVGIIVLMIVAAILLRVLGANAGNTIVRDIHDAAATLVGPFKNVFTIKDPKVSIAVNWGIAALVYLIVGGFIARLLARAAPAGRGVA